MSASEPSAQQVSEAVAAAFSTVLAHPEAHRKLIPLSQAVHRHMDAVIAPVVEGAACRAGCSYCCSIPVPVAPLEAFELAQFVLTRFSDVELSALMDRLEAYRAAWVGADPGLPRFRMPCPLLGGDGRCTAYEARPMACRTYHSFSVEACAADAASEQGSPVPYREESEGAVMPILSGLCEAAEARGLSHEPVLLAGGLAIALTDPEAANRWLSGDNPFAGASLAADFAPDA